MLTSLLARQDTFEDAVDTSEVRSLTKRTPSVSTQRPSKIAPELPSPNDDLPPKEVEPLAASSPTSPDDEPKASSPVSNRISSTSNLDNVNLDDDVAASQAGSSPSTVHPT